MAKARRFNLFSLLLNPLSQEAFERPALQQLNATLQKPELSNVHDTLGHIFGIQNTLVLQIIQSLISGSSSNPHLNANTGYFFW
jgi:hypothetical protein